MVINSCFHCPMFDASFHFPSTVKVCVSWVTFPGANSQLICELSPSRLLLELPALPLSAVGGRGGKDKYEFPVTSPGHYASLLGMIVVPESSMKPVWQSTGGSRRSHSKQARDRDQWFEEVIQEAAKGRTKYTLQPRGCRRTCAKLQNHTGAFASFAPLAGQFPWTCTQI